MPAGGFVPNCLLSRLLTGPGGLREQRWLFWAPSLLSRATSFLDAHALRAMRERTTVATAKELRRGDGRGRNGRRHAVRIGVQE